MKTIAKGRFPYYSVEPADGRNTGLTVIFYHGWGTSAESYLEFAKVLAEEGYTAIVPELIYHDSRNPLANPFYPAILQEYFWKTIFKSMDEFNGLLEELEIPAEQVVVAGSSMGGFIAAGIGAQQKCLAGTASINGSGSFLRTEQLLRKQDRRPVLLPGEESVLKNCDPARQEGFSGPLLLLHGKEDKTIPVEGQLDYYQCRVGKHGPEHTTMILYDGVGHQFTDEMARDFVGWLNGLQKTQFAAEEINSPVISREIKELLGYTITFDGIEKAYGEYIAAADQRLYAFKLRGAVVGCLGIHLKEERLEIKHIAVFPEARGQGVGSGMIDWANRKHSPNVIAAETDREAVGFYRKAGFAAISLGEKYPGVERFRCERKGMDHGRC